MQCTIALTPLKSLDYTSPAFFWANIELSIAVVSACLPTLKPVFIHFFPPPPKTQSKSTSYIRITDPQASRQSGKYSTEPGKDSVPLRSMDPASGAGENQV